MSDAIAPQGAPAFAIPEYAHTDLVQLRDHLQLMSLLTAAGPEVPAQDLRLGMAWWFARVEKEIDGILDASVPPTLV